MLFKAFIKDIQILRSAISFSENLIFDLLVQLSSFKYRFNKFYWAKS